MNPIIYGNFSFFRRLWSFLLKIKVLLFLLFQLLRLFHILLMDELCFIVRYLYIFLKLFDCYFIIVYGAFHWWFIELVRMLVDFYFFFAFFLQFSYYFIAFKLTFKRFHFELHTFYFIVKSYWIIYFFKTGKFYVFLIVIKFWQIFVLLSHLITDLLLFFNLFF